MRRWIWWSDLRQDVRYGVRSALRSPLFSLLAIITLALGIGANAAVFSVLKSSSLDALPYADANRLVRVYGRFLDGSDDRLPLSAGTISDVAEQQRSFERLASFSTSTPDAVYGDDGGPHIVTAAWVEPGLFRTLGVPAALGRAFNDNDAQDTARVVLLTHAAWQQLFGGDSDVLGRDVRINRIPRTVIVLPRDFAGLVGEADVYFPLDLASTLRDPIRARRNYWLGLVGRVTPGVTQEAVQRELAAIGADLAREYPEANGGIGLAPTPLRDAMVGDTRTPLLVLMASAGLVLLITCANLAGALLSRTISRRKEFAVRAALGAGRGRVIRQLLTESALLALAGGAAGLLLAMLGLAAVRDLALPMIPAYADLSLDAGAVLVMALVALGTGLAFGMAPALSVGRSDPEGALRDETRGASEGRRSRHLRGALVAGQIALCISLLAGAGLLARSLWTMTSTPLGVDPDGVLAMAIRLPSRDYPTAEAGARFQEQLAQRLRALPNVDAVATASELPTTVGSRMGFTIGGAPLPNDVEPFVLYASVSDDYFRTLRIPTSARTHL